MSVDPERLGLEGVLGEGREQVRGPTQTAGPLGVRGICMAGMLPTPTPKLSKLPSVLLLRNLLVIRQPPTSLLGMVGAHMPQGLKMLMSE